MEAEACWCGAGAPSSWGCSHAEVKNHGSIASFPRKVHPMANPTYEPKITALLCVDFYNDFLSEGGKLWPWVKEIAEQVKLLDNLRTIVPTARAAGPTVFHGPPHPMAPDTYKDWKYPAPYQLQAAKSQIFAKG